jgi:hypothetical protein
MGSAAYPPVIRVSAHLSCSSTQKQIPIALALADPAPSHQGCWRSGLSEIRHLAQPTNSAIGVPRDSAKGRPV